MQVQVSGKWAADKILQIDFPAFFLLHMYMVYTYTHRHEC
jgi:hypothetical protein